MRSVYLQKNKDIFKVPNLPAEEYAQSIGLPGAPKIKFVKSSAKASAAKEAQRAEIMAKAAAKADEEEEEESSSEEESDAEENMPQTKKTAKPTSKIEKMFLRKNQNILSEHYNKLVDFEEDNLLNSKEGGHEDDDFITIKRRDHKLESDEEAEPMLPMSRRQLKLGKAALAKKQSKGERIVFDDEGKVSYMKQPAVMFLFVTNEMDFSLATCIVRNAG